MAKLNFLHICEDAFLTEGSRNLNLIGIFDTINTTGFPAVHPRFAIVANVTADNVGKHQISIIIKKGDNKIHEKTISFEGLTHQVINNIINLPFPEEGVYEVNVNLDNQVIGQTSLTLKKIQKS